MARAWGTPPYVMARWAHFARPLWTYDRPSTRRSLRNNSASFAASRSMECLATTRSCPASPMRCMSSAGREIQSSIAFERSSTDPAGNSQPFSPCRTSSGIPAMYVVSTGRLSANASMSATGSPSAKLGRTSARDASNSARTASLLIQPVMRTLSPSPHLATRSSIRPRIGPSPANTKGNRIPFEARRATAAIKSS